MSLDVLTMDLTALDTVKAVFLGIVEGLTEFIPVSSTGHLLLVEHFFGFDDEDFGKAFAVLIQLGAILALLSIYFTRLWQLFLGIFKNNEDRRFVIGVLVAFLPAMVIGALAYGFIKSVLFNVWIVCTMLVIGGFLLLWIDRLDLKPLSLDETSTLLSATLDGSVDPDAAQRLWNLTRGNVLYLRTIVDQEVADGRLVKQRGFWRWTGEPMMPPGLVELIESRIGALPTPVSDVVDALAVGEPIELTALRRITDPAAVEEAETRGLITLEPAVSGVEVRVAHPLYGEVRRRRAAATKLRRLRGLVAAELAAADDHDDIQVVVRRLRPVRRMR